MFSDEKVEIERAGSFHVVNIRPRDHFGSIANLFHLAGVVDGNEIHFRYFDLPQLAVIVDASGNPVWEPTFYLADLALHSQSRKGDTVRTYAEALLPWLVFLHRRGTCHEEVDEECLGIYRAQVVNGQIKGARGRYSSATANLRITIVCSFYTWGQRKKLMCSPLGNYLLDDDRKRQPQAWRSTGRRRLTPLMPTVIHRMPRVLSIEEIQRVCMIASPPYRLMLRWCVTTGMRRFEVCDLMLSDLPTPIQVSQNQDGLIRLSIVRKGARVHTVHVPISLIEETNWYILTERPNPKQSHESYVFLNAAGRAVSRTALTKAFRKSANAIGSDATLHHLRHTFAVHVLGILERRDRGEEDLNSIKTLQVLLGHSNSVTTEIYLQAMETSAPSVIAALQYLYGASL